MDILPMARIYQCVNKTLTMPPTWEHLGAPHGVDEEAEESLRNFIPGRPSPRSCRGAASLLEMSSGT